MMISSLRLVFDSKIMKIALLLLLSVFTVLAQDQKTTEVGPNEFHVTSYDQGHDAKITTSSYNLGDFTCMEVIILNQDGSVRGRVVRYYKDNKQYKAIAYKGFSTPWFTEVDDNRSNLPSGEILLTRLYDPSGNILAGQLCSKNGEFLHYVGAHGKKITEETSSDFASQIGYYLFGKKLVEQPVKTEVKENPELESKERSQ